MKKIIQNLFTIIAITTQLFFYSCNDSDLETNLTINTPLKEIESTQLKILGHWLGEGKKEQFMKELVNEFEFTNQEISIHMQWADSIYDTRSTENGELTFNINMVTTDKSLWDVIRINNNTFLMGAQLNETNPNWAKKYFVDFSENEAFRQNTRPELLTDVIKREYNGIIPGPFIDGYNWTIWCNTLVAEKMGIDVKQFGMTNDDFLTYLKLAFEYNLKNNDSIITLYDAGDWSTTEHIANMLFFSELDSYNEILDQKFSIKKLNAWFKVLKEMERFSQYKPIPKNWKSVSWGETNNFPIKDKCLFFINATWMYNIWLEEDRKMAEKMTPIEMPVFKKSSTCIGGYGCTWAVPLNAPNKEEAIRFLTSINNSGVADKWSRYTKSPCGIKGSFTNSSFGLDKFERYQYEIDRKYGSNKIGSINDASFCFGKENAQIRNYSKEVLTGEMTAKQAIKEINKQLKLN